MDRLKAFGAFWFVLVLPVDSLAGSQTATDCSYAAVSAAINAAAPGDTVEVPQGSCSWSSPLVINKGIDLIGKGAGSTTITSDTDSFLITYDPSDYSLNTPFRLSGFTFDMNHSGPGLSLGVKKAQPFTLQTKIRVDHNHFRNASGPAIKHWGMYGVIDHNEFSGTGYPLRANAAEGADGIPIGQTWWNHVAGIDFGAPDNNLYFEDNIFTDVTSVITDCQYGARFAFRYNTVTAPGDKWPLMDMHGEQSDGGGYCSCFGGELYGNNFINDNNDVWPLLDQRGGKVVLFYNNVSNSAKSMTRVRDKIPGDWCNDTNAQPNDVSETYIWSNRDDLTGPVIPVTFSAVSEDAQAWQYKTGFDGSSGIGCGTVTQMNAISTCSEGVGYWATDQSCTDLTGHVGANPTTPISGTLYRCGKSNDWVAYYTPLAYPHPLISGQQPADAGIVDGSQLDGSQLDGGRFNDGPSDAHSPPDARSPPDAGTNAPADAGTDGNGGCSGCSMASTTDETLGVGGLALLFWLMARGRRRHPCRAIDR